MAVESTLLNAYEIEDILAYIINDLKSFGNGVEMPDGSTIFGTLIAFTGDNPASHKIGGLKEGFTAAHCCRSCMASLDKIRTLTREDISLIKTLEEYNDQIDKLEKAKTSKKRKELSTEFGINRNSALNSLEHFHILSGLPSDVFHDIMEGSLLKTLQLLLAHFLLGESKVMMVQEFNDKLVEFDYGYSETKPSMILPQYLKDGANLQQTGMQIWYLSYFVPFILGPYIDPKNEFWKNYILVLEISSLACAYEISATMLG